MTIETAIEILNNEIYHIQLHLMEKGKAPIYYEELNQLATAMTMGVAELRQKLEERADNQY